MIVTKKSKNSFYFRHEFDVKVKISITHKKPPQGQLCRETDIDQKPLYQSLLLNSFLLPKAPNLTGNIPGKTKLLPRELHLMVSGRLISQPQQNVIKIRQDKILKSSLLSEGSNYQLNKN